MIELSDLGGVVMDVNAGEIGMDDLYALCLELMRWHPTESVLCELPPHVRAQMAAWLRRDFDNAVAAADYVWFTSGRGDQPDKELIIERVRSWLRDEGGRGPAEAPDPMRA